MLLHANAITQDRAAGVWTCRIDGYDSDRVALLAVMFRQLIDKRALARTWRTSKTDGSGFACVGK